MAKLEKKIPLCSGDLMSYVGLHQFIYGTGDCFLFNKGLRFLV